MNVFVNNYIYFYHLDKFCVLPDYPESVTDQLQSDFASENALARTAPVFSYKNSGPRSINITLKMHRDMMNDLNRNVSNLKDNTVDFSGKDYIDVLIKYLQAAALPRYNEYSSGSKMVIPPMVAIRFGNEIFIKGVVNGGIQVTYQKPILIGEKYALVDVTFNVYEVDPYDADAVVDMGSFRGINRTFKDGIFKGTGESLGFNLSEYASSMNTESLTTYVQNDVKTYKAKKVNTSTTKSSWHTASSGDTHGGHGASFGGNAYDSGGGWHTSSSGDTHGGHGSTFDNMWKGVHGSIIGNKFDIDNMQTHTSRSRSF